MTGPGMRHTEYEELISASLSGELSADERRRLDAHLDTCDACRGTLAAFADGRRIVAGLRHVPAPRDLHARVRGGIERGRFAPLPWYRRPAVLFTGVGGGLAAVAGALLAIVLLGDSSAPVGEATPSPTATAVASATPVASASFPAGPTPTPAESTPVPSATQPQATSPPEPEPASPEPDAYLALTGPIDNRALTVRDGPTGETIAEVDTPPGPPVAAELSPDGQWIAYITPVGEKGTHEVRVSRIGEAVAGDDPEAPTPIDSPIEPGETVLLGESLAGDPFAEQLFWSSPRGAHLAYTLTDPESGSTDVWLFEPEIGEFRQLTDVGNAYAASWTGDDARAASSLWVSVADARPVSYLHGFPFDAGPEPLDPAPTALATADGVFQPLLSPNGSLAIYWKGAMDRAGDGTWRFVSGAQPYLAEHVREGDRVVFDDERRMFSDLSVGREAFTSAAMAWGEDGDAYAVWNVRWTGEPQSGSGEDPYPDGSRVYFGHAADARGLTRAHAIDRDDLPEGWSVIDVKVSPTGEHLVVTVAEPVGGVLDAARASVLLIERNTGNEPDEVSDLRSEPDQWFGPAAFDRRSDGDRP